MNADTLPDHVSVLPPCLARATALLLHSFAHTPAAETVLAVTFTLWKKAAVPANTDFT